METDTTAEKSASLDLDDLLPQVGEFGKYQKLMLWFVCLPACFPCGFCAFNQLFMADTPEYWCKVPLLSNLTIEKRKALGIPNNNKVYNKCERYAVNWMEILQDYDFQYDSIQVNTSWPTESCLDGWEFDKSEITSSIVIDFDLVCEKDIYPTLGLMALNIGGPIGVYFFGVLNDTIGRKKSFFTCLTTALVGSILSATAQNFIWWAFSRVIVGLTVPALYQIPFIISLELVGPSYRSFVTVMTCIFYTLSLMILAGITYMIRNWVHLTLATSLPFVLYYLYWFLLPESPRWLLARGKFQEALHILDKLARINNKELPPTFQHLLKQKILAKKDKSRESIQQKGCWDLCSTPNMRLKTCLITLGWFATSTVYVGLSYYGPALGDNQYFSFFMASLVEIPSYLICWFLLDKWGRRWPLSLSMTISGITCIATSLVPSEMETVILVLYLISKWAISASFLIIYPFSGELYPTQLRGIGIGVSSYIGGLGLIIIPFVNYLERLQFLAYLHGHHPVGNGVLYQILQTSCIQSLEMKLHSRRKIGSDDLSLPLVIMGVISVIGGILSLRLPETLHHRLPETLEEGEAFGKDFSLTDCFRCIPLKSAVPDVTSYENLELESMKYQDEATEVTPLEIYRRRMSMKKLVRQNSTLETQKDIDGTMKMTYWF